MYIRRASPFRILLMKNLKNSGKKAFMSRPYQNFTIKPHKTSRQFQTEEYSFIGSTGNDSGLPKS